MVSNWPRNIMRAGGNKRAQLEKMIKNARKEGKDRKAAASDKCVVS
jgi:hypothetical protein